MGCCGMSLGSFHRAAAAHRGVLKPGFHPLLAMSLVGSGYFFVYLPTSGPVEGGRRQWQSVAGTGIFLTNAFNGAGDI